MAMKAGVVRLTLLVASAITAVGIAEAQRPSPTARDTPAIGGYSPVSYFTEHAAERGSSEYSVRHDGRTYHLTSREQVRKFEANPERYLPKFGQHCPYNLALGRTKPIDPTNFKILAGQLLLFHRSDEQDGLAEWNNSELSEQELMRRADKHYRLMSF